MISKEVRSQFSVFVFLASVDDNTELKGSLVESGYESFVFVDQDALVERLKTSPPHVIVFSPDALITPLSEFVTQVLEANSEIQFVCVAPAENADALADYQEYNFSALVTTGAHLPARVIWSLDQTSENLYRVYQNEDLITKVELAEARLKTAEQEASRSQIELQTRTEIDASQTSLADKMRSYEKCHAKDDFVLAFLKRLPCKAIFFKFLPTVSSFVATAAHGMDIESMKGVGSRMNLEESKDVKAFLSSGRVPQALEELMRDGLKVEKFFSKMVTVPQGPEGLIVFWGNDFHPEKIEDDFLVFQLLYQQAYLLKRNEGLDIYDPVTELLNRPQFYKKLDEEIARARRLEKPISVIRISIDHISEIEQSFGRSNRDLILRTIASIIKKTSRVNDYSCRTEDNHFSLILPHCGRKGAALRAERLRRIIESHAFALNDLKVTVSAGVSEYPSLATGASDLDASAGKALDFIIGKGGNKVCLYKPMQEFKPDFEVPPM